MPTVWIIKPYRAGEQAQVSALATALGWPVVTKQLEYRSWVVLPHLLGSASIAGINGDSQHQLTAPWPDFVISCGVRNEPVCRWIREQSGGHTRYIHVGRPWGPLEGFDLVITTPQYRIPQRDNVVQNTLTLNNAHHYGTKPSSDEDAALSDLPGPRIAVLAGGNSGPFTFGPNSARRLLTQASALARSLQGSLMITTSARTADSACAVLAQDPGVPSAFYRWRANDSANPYRQMLALADRIIVTGDSIGMLSEAVATGKPVHIFDLGGMRDGAEKPSDRRLGARLYAFMLRWLWQPLSRDITLVHRALVDTGQARWLDDTPGENLAERPASCGHRSSGHADLERAVAAVRRLQT